MELERETKERRLKMGGRRKQRHLIKQRERVRERELEG